MGKMSFVLSLFGIALSTPHSSDINAYLPLTPPTIPGLNFLESWTIKQVPSGVNPIITFGPSMQRGRNDCLISLNASLSLLYPKYPGNHLLIKNSLMGTNAVFSPFVIEQ